MNRLVVHCMAQLHPCRFSGTSDVGHVEGITVQRLTVMEKSGNVGATVFIPDGNELLPSIVFSHSAIHGPITMPTYCVLHGHWLGPEQLQSSLTE